MTRHSCEDCPEADVCLGTATCPRTGEPIVDDDAWSEVVAASIRTVAPSIARELLHKRPPHA